MSDSEASIDGEGSVEIVVSGQAASRGAIDEHRADIRTGPEVLAYPCHGKVRRRRPGRGYRLGLHAQEADVGVGADLAGQPPAAQDRDLLTLLANSDSTTEEDFDLARLPHREEPGVLQKEGSFFWEEQIESVEVDLLVVDLHLCEVGVVGNVQGHAGGDAVFEVGSDITERGCLGVGESSRPARTASG